jgi:hypothetical protein
LPSYSRCTPSKPAFLRKRRSRASEQGILNAVDRARSISGNDTTINVALDTYYEYTFKAVTVRDGFRASLCSPLNLTHISAD